MVAKKVSTHPNRFTYQYLRCMHGAERSHQWGHLKGHLRTAGWGDNVGGKNVKKRIRSETHCIQDVL